MVFWKIHIHIRKIQVIEVFFSQICGDACCEFFVRCHLRSMRRTTIYKPPPSQKKTQKHTHMKPEPAAAGGKTPLCRKKPNPTNGRSSKVETQCCRYDHLNLWLRTRSGCYDSGRTTTCDRYTWCGCGNGIYLRSRRKVVEGWRYFGQKSDGIWVWIVLVIE